MARWKKKLEINHDYINEGKKPEPVPPRQTISTGSHVYIKESEMPWCSQDWLGVVHRIDGGGRYKVIPINPEKYTWNLTLSERHMSEGLLIGRNDQVIPEAEYRKKSRDVYRK